jgi:hypothetical protein
MCFLRNFNLASQKNGRGAAISGPAWTRLCNSPHYFLVSAGVDEVKESESLFIYYLDAMKSQVTAERRGSLAHAPQA